MNSRATAGKKHLIYLIMICLAGNVINALAQPSFLSSDYRFQHYDMSDGLASENANAIVQDSLGFVWVLHDNGLSRYDGYTFKAYRYNPNDAMSMGPTLDGFLELDRSGNLWLVSNQGLDPNLRVTMTKYIRQKDAFEKHYPDLQGAIVRSVCFDKNDSIIWMGSWGRGLYRFNILTGKTKSYFNTHTDNVVNVNNSPEEEQQNAIFGISDRDSILLLATWKGLWQFNKKTNTFSYPKYHPSDTSLLFNAPIVAIIESKHNRDVHIVVHELGLVRLGDFISGKATILLEAFSEPRMRTFQQDKDGVFWLADLNNGLHRFDPANRSLVTVVADPEDAYSLRSNGLNACAFDRDQNLWIATIDRGISKLPKQRLRFFNYRFGGAVSGNVVYTANKKSYVVVSHNKYEGENEIVFSPVESSNLQNLNFSKVIIKPPFKAKISQLAMGKNHLWIGTQDTRIVSADGVIGLSVNPSSGLLDPEPAYNFKSDPVDPNSIGGNSNSYGTFIASGFLEDSDENLWVGNASMGGGLYKIKLNMPYGQQGSVVRYSHIPSDSTSLSNDVIWWEMLPEGNDSFWAITGSGLDLFRNGSFEHYFKNDYVVTVKRDSNGKLLVGTTTGLYEGIPGERYQFRKDPSKDLSRYGVYAFQEDKLGRLWITTHRNLHCYDRQRKVVIHFGEADGFHFGRDWVEKTSEGVFLTADGRGLSLFDPYLFQIEESPTFPVLTSLTINNEVVQVQNGKANSGQYLVTQDIGVLNKLTIDYRHNNFAIEFSAMEMTAPEKNVYRHRLEGYDKDWIETDFRNRKATYTNLDAGEYTFRVKASNHHGIWSDNERTLKIVVLPPPWKSAWAYTAYGIMFIALAYAARMNIVQRERLKSKLKLEKVEREKEHFELEKAKEVDKVKSTFFANISHEFRTPLTLIKGPVQEMLEEFSDHPKVKDRLMLVQRNADMVLKLINQLLYLAKLESGSLTIEKSQHDLNSFLRAVTNSFSSLAFQKRIRIEMELAQLTHMVIFDKDKVETILMNLINNAIKFTPEGGRINIRAFLNTTGEPTKDELTLIVSDNGIGIEKEQHDLIFERFHQINESHKEVGTGIGLSLVKELVALMKGTVSLKSEPGKGSEFIVVLPVEATLEPTVEEVETFQAQVVADVLTPELKENGRELKGSRPQILVVEDNSDLRKFIIDSMSNEFSFLEAADGTQGLKIAVEETPDVIISDVMMPEMDGITMAAKIKHDIRTSHIPLILLTAKTAEESKLAGLSTGADDYLTKPFNKNELMLKVRNSIGLRVKLREKIKLELLSEGPRLEVQSADERFLNHLRETILSRLDDLQLSVGSLAEEMALSRSQLLRKVTALTGTSVNELIRTFRLQKAAQLLEQNWGTVTQVAYEVGFSNLSYFSKAFKEKFGVLPSEYAVKT